VKAGIDLSIAGVEAGIDLSKAVGHDIKSGVDGAINLTVDAVEEAGKLVDEAGKLVDGASPRLASPCLASPRLASPRRALPCLALPCLAWNCVVLPLGTVRDAASSSRSGPDSSSCVCRVCVDRGV
jgi:hypothetical protein